MKGCWYGSALKITGNPAESALFCARSGYVITKTSTLCTSGSVLLFRIQHSLSYYDEKKLDSNFEIKNI